MYFTARQIQEMLRDVGVVALPAGARLTPAASDLVRQRKIEVHIGPVVPSANSGLQVAAHATSGSGRWLWWCGTTSGTAKAAMTMLERESDATPLAVAQDATQLSTALLAVDAAVAQRGAPGAVIALDHAGPACVLANRSPRLRAIVGTSLASVDAGITQIAANVLLLEPAGMSLMSMRNLLLRFVRAPRSSTSSFDALLEQLAGGAR